MIEASDINRHNVPSASKTVIKHDRKSHVRVKSQHFLAGKRGCMLPVLPSSINEIYLSFFSAFKSNFWNFPVGFNTYLLPVQALHFPNFVLRLHDQ